MQVEEVPSLDAKLSDIAIGTSAAPTLLPPHGFWNGKRAFNLVDGGIAAGSPALVAVSEVIQQLNEKNPNFIPMNPNEPTKFVLLSLGCGRNKIPGTLASIASSFSYNYWMRNVLPLGLASAAADIHEYHLGSVFPDLPSSHNYYLRVEEYNLNPFIVNATEEGMQKLVKAGEDLLKQPVKIQNVTSFVPYEKPSEGSNDEALKRLADILIKEKERRLKMKSMEKRGPTPPPSRMVEME